MVKAIRENLHYGAQLIKIVVDDQRYIYSVDDIKFMIAEAGRAGAKVAAHVWTREGAHNAAAAGVASMEHLNGVADEDLELAKKNGVTAVFTPFPPAALNGFRGDEEGARAEFQNGSGSAAGRHPHRDSHCVRIGCDLRVARQDARQHDDRLGG